MFDTYKTSIRLDHFIAQDIPAGFIVVAACKDDCATRLSERAKGWFADMGSKEIWKLEYRQGFVFISVRGSGTATEARATEGQKQVSIT